MEPFVFKLGVNNSKVKKYNFHHRVSNLKWHLTFYKIKLVTWKKSSIDVLELVTGSFFYSFYLELEFLLLAYIEVAYLAQLGISVCC